MNALIKGIWYRYLKMKEKYSIAGGVNWMFSNIKYSCNVKVGYWCLYTNEVVL